MLDRIGTAIGASRTAGTSLFVLFVPSVDREGLSIDHEYWVEEALIAFGTHLRGATAYPRAIGVWRDDERGGTLVRDEPTIVTCYANPEEVTDEVLLQLRQFFHRLGRETNQGEIGVIVDNRYYPITRFDRNDG